MLKRSISILITALSLASVNQSYGQVCLENLRKARTVYDEGRLHEILDVLGETCLTGNDLNEEEKSEAYRLLILAYIYQDLPDEADQSMLALLKTNPRFKVDHNSDPDELINLYNTFRTAPIFRWGVKVTPNAAFVNITNTYSVNNSTSANGTYSTNLSFSFGGFIEKDFFNKKLTLQAEPHLALHKVTYKANGFPQDQTPEIFTTKWEDEETQTWLGLNILSRYGLLQNKASGKRSQTGNKINPYLIFGPSIQYLFNSSLSATTDITGGESASGADINLTKPSQQIRRKINLSAVVGLGIVFPQKKFSFITDITYRHGLINMTKQHTSPELTFRYGRAMSDMKVSAVNLSLGVMFNQYNPKKLENEY